MLSGLWDIITAAFWFIVLMAIFAWVIYPIFVFVLRGILGAIKHAGSYWTDW